MRLPFGAATFLSFPIAFTLCAPALQIRCGICGAHKDLGKLTGKFSGEVPSHGVVMVTVNP